MNILRTFAAGRKLYQAFGTPDYSPMEGNSMKFRENVRVAVYHKIAKLNVSLAAKVPSVAINHQSSCLEDSISMACNALSLGKICVKFGSKWPGQPAKRHHVT